MPKIAYISELRFQSHCNLQYSLSQNRQNSFINFNYQFIGLYNHKKNLLIAHMQLNTEQMIEQDSIPDYEVCSDSIDADTLVFLKHPKKLAIKLSSKDALPNFIVLPDAKKSNIHKLSLKAMIQQPVARQLMIKKFCELARQRYDGKIKEQQQINKFQKLMITNFDQLNQKDRQNAVLKEYTNASFFHSLLNSLLRSGTDAMELFYCHYFVQIMSKSIKQLYRTYDQGQRKFKCYRGAYLSEQEINNLKNLIGKHIEVLGFLSTSLDQKTARSFAENTLLHIIVDDENRSNQSDYGYAFMKGVSYIPQEKQVLFNALCSFQVVDVYKKQVNGIEISVIKLKYGSLAKLMAKYKDNKELEFSKTQKQILPMLMHQDYNDAPYQGEILPQFSKQKIEYYHIFLDLIKTCQIYQKNTLNSKLKYVLTHSTINYTQSQKAKEQLAYIQKLRQQQGIVFDSQFYFLKQFIEANSKDQIKQKSVNYILQWELQCAELQKYLQKKKIEDGNSQILSNIIRYLIQKKTCIIFLKQRCIQDYNESELKQELQQLKRSANQHLGQFHPIYISILRLEIQMTKKLTSPKAVSLSQQQINKTNKYYELLKLSSPDKLPNQQQQLFHYRQLIAPYLQKNQFQQAVSIYIQQRDKLFAQYIPKSDQQKKGIQNELLKPIIAQLACLVDQEEFLKSLPLVKKIKNHSKIQVEQFEKFEQMVLQKQKEYQDASNEFYQPIVNCLKKQKIQIKRLKQIEKSHAEFLIKIAKLLGQDSEMYSKHQQLQQLIIQKIQSFQETVQNQKDTTIQQQILYENVYHELQKLSHPEQLQKLQGCQEPFEQYMITIAKEFGQDSETYQQYQQLQEFLMLTIQCLQNIAKNKQSS